MRLHSASLLILLASASAADAADLRCRGHVFLDRNADAQRDSREPGIAGAGVSDGTRIVRTGSDGRFDFRVEDGRSVFLIKPAGYALPNQTKLAARMQDKIVIGKLFSQALVTGDAKGALDGVMKDIEDLKLLA